MDICKEVARFAREVHVTLRSEARLNVWKQLGIDNLWLHLMIERAHEDGTVAFQDGIVVLADVIVHCTGYEYHHPFLNAGGAVTVDDNRVGPLFNHVFPPALAPGLSFVGIPSFVIPFFLCELQSKWIAGILSGRISLPSQEKMMEGIETSYSKLEATGVPKHYTHRIQDFQAIFAQEEQFPAINAALSMFLCLFPLCTSWQFQYEDWLAKECGCPSVEEWRKDMFHANYIRMTNRPNTFRDEFDDDEELISQAQQDFVQYLPAGGIGPIGEAKL